MSQIKCAKASVIVGGGTDRIALFLEAATTFPKMGYPPVAHIEATPGHGVEWVRAVLGVEPEVLVEYATDENGDPCVAEQKDGNS